MPVRRPFPAPTPRHLDALCDRQASELISQPGFADSRLAAEQEQMAMTGRHIGQTCAQLR